MIVNSFQEAISAAKNGKYLRNVLGKTFNLNPDSNYSGDFTIFEDGPWEVSETPFSKVSLTFEEALNSKSVKIHYTNPNRVVSYSCLFREPNFWQPHEINSFSVAEQRGFFMEECE